MKQVFTGVLFLLLCSAVIANVRHVPGQYANIQAGLNNCLTGDTVFVQPGVYYENISWPMVNGIKLIAAGDTSNCIIDGNGNGRVLEMEGGNFIGLIDTTTLIQGFTIRNGRFMLTYTNGGGFGAGMYLSQVGLSLKHVRVTGNNITGDANNSNTAWGAGCFATNCRLYMYDVDFSNNNITYSNNAEGGAMWCASSTLHITHSGFTNNYISSNSNAIGSALYLSVDTTTMNFVKIAGNTCSAVDVGFANGGAAFYAGYGKYDLANIILSQNNGSGLSIGQADFHLTNSLIAENKNPTWGYIISVGDYAQAYFTGVTIVNNEAYGMPSYTFSSYTNARAELNNCILWDSTDYELTGDTFVINHCDIKNSTYPNSTIINANPAFAGDHDYHLTCSSPVINQGDLNYSGAYDLDGIARPLPAGTNPDMGCYEFNQTFSANISATGSTLLCPFDSVLLTATPVNGVSYQWQRNGMNIPLANAPNYYAKQNGNYNVVLSTNTSCALPSASIAVQVRTDYAQITCSADTVFCDGDSLILYAPVGQGITYNWLKNGSIISSSNQNTFPVKETGTYSLNVSNAGCNTGSQQISATVLPSPPIPVIYLQHDTFFTTTSGNLQWYVNGQFIPTATESFYKPGQQHGSYQVSNTNNEGCVSFSQQVSFPYTGMEQLTTGILTAYPNPANQYVFLQTEDNIQSIEVFNLFGQLVISYAGIASNNYSLKVEALSAGNYLAKVYTKQGVILHKLSVIHP